MIGQRSAGQKRSAEKGWNTLVKTVNTLRPNELRKGARGGKGVAVAKVR
jgi:hypothetical protein